MEVYICVFMLTIYGNMNVDECKAWHHFVYFCFGMHKYRSVEKFPKQLHSC